MPAELKQTPGLHPSQRPFVGRGDLRALFEKTLKNKKPDEHKVLVFYGVAGIGKSRLRQQLEQDLKDMWKAAMCMTLDFEAPDSPRTAQDALPNIRWTLNDEYKIPFPTFDIAFTYYWRKNKPYIALSEDKDFSLWDESNIAFGLIKTFGELPYVDLVPKVAKVIAKAPKLVQKMWTKHNEKALELLPQMEAKNIEDRLPKFLAMDIKNYLKKFPVPLVIFLDTYEELLGKERSEYTRYSRDKWVRELVYHLPQALWVICGRTELEWKSDHYEWDAHLQPHKVLGLEEEYAKQFLDNCRIEKHEIRKAILRASQEAIKRYSPIHLTASVKSYFIIRDRKKREPVVSDFAKTPADVFRLFLRHLNKSEEETVKVLSAARIWDDNLAEILLKEFNTGYPSTDLSALYKICLIEDGPASEQHLMHDLMRRSLQEHQDKSLRKKVQKFLFNHYNGQLKGINIKSITDTHKTALTEAFYHASETMEPKKLASWVVGVGPVFHEAAQWAAVIPVYEEALVLLGEDQPYIGSILNNLALFFMSQGRYGEAEPLYKRALAIDEKARGKDHVPVAIRLNNLALLYVAQGRYSEAEPLYKRALEIDEKSLGKDHLNVATDLNNLALLYDAQGRYSEAEPLYKRALTIINEKSLGEDHPYVASGLNNLAGLCYDQGRYDEAEPLYKRALAIDEKALGKDHPDVATDLNNLALLYKSQGRYVEAEPLYKRALDVWEKALGKEHPNVASSLNNLALLYQSQSRYSKAEPLYKQALEINEKALGKDHPNVATGLNNLALLYRATDRYPEAEPLYKRALAIDEKALGKDHPNVATDLNNLAALYYAQGRYDEAELLYKRALEIYEKALPPYHPNLATLLENMADLYRETGRENEAQKLEERAREIRERRKK